MSSREPAKVRFNGTGDCVNVGEYKVSLSYKKKWWHRLLPRVVRISVCSDVGGEQRYWLGQWWKL